ncbi:MAG: hypothetical protein M3P16_02980 [Chloroflexota bacterium]|nr:hypothetical protein [Chloroflexota bacterium]
MSAVGWALGTFHTSVVGIALLLLVYPGGGLSVALGGLSTISDLALFGALWSTTVYSTGRATRGLRLLGADRAASGAFYRRALRWGAANGVLFFVALVVIVVTNAVVTAPPGAPSVQIGAILPIAALEVGLGTMVAFAIGALLGLVLATLDLVALRIARAVVGPTA